MAARLKINRSAVTKYFTSDPIAQTALRAVAEGLKDVAVEASPVGTSLGWGGRTVRHGQFKRSWSVRPFRGGFRVVNSDPFSHLVEYGSIKNPAYAPARRALRSVAGGKVALHGRGQHIARVGGEFGSEGRS